MKKWYYLVLLYLVAVHTAVGVSMSPSGDLGDIGLGATVVCTFSGFTGPGELSVEVSEGGYMQEDFSAEWRGDPVILGTFLPDGTFVPDQIPEFIITDGGTTWPNQNPEEEGADITVEFSFSEYDVDITAVPNSISFSADPLYLGESCNASVGFARGITGDVIFEMVGGAAGCTVDSDGTITAGCTDGEVTVRATSVEDDNCYVEGSLTIARKPPADWFGKGDSKLDSIHYRFSLGLQYDGESLGNLFIDAVEPDISLTKPKTLQIQKADSDDVVVYYTTNSPTAIRQVRIPQGLVDVVAVDEYEYRINYYTNFSLPFDGTFFDTSSAEPLQYYIVENPYDYPGTWQVNHFWITHVYAGVSNRTEYFWDEWDETWYYSEGNGLRLETMGVTVFTNGSDRTQYDRIVMDASSNVANRTTETYQEFSWGRQLVQKEAWDGLISEYFFFDENGPQEGRLSAEDHSDGYARELSYTENGWREQEWVRWKNDPFYTNTTQLTSWSYEPIDSFDLGTVRSGRARLITKSIYGITTKISARSYYTNAIGDRVEIQEKFLFPSAAFGDSGNLRTVRIYYDGGGDHPFGDKIKSATYPDGRTEQHEYEMGLLEFQNITNGTYTFTVNTNSSAKRFMQKTVTYGTTAHTNGIAYKTLQEQIYTSWQGYEVLHVQSVYTGLGYEPVSWTVWQRDGFGHALAEYRSNGTFTESGWGYSGQTNETLLTGQQFAYEYDILGRMLSAETSLPDGGAVSTQYTYNAEGQVLTEALQGDSIELVKSNAYDLAGRLISSMDFDGTTTTWGYDDAARTTVQTNADGGIVVTELYQDRRIKSITGTAVVPVYYDYGAYSDGSQWTTEYTGSDGTNSLRWTRTVTDMAGRPIREEITGTGGTVLTNSYEYNALGQLARKTHYFLPDTLYEYDDLSRVTAEGYDLNDNGTLDQESDRVVGYQYGFQPISGDWWQKTDELIYPWENDNTEVYRQTQRVRLSGFSGTLSDEIRTIDIDGNTNIVRRYVNRPSAEIREETVFPDSTVSGLNIYTNGLLCLARTSTGAEQKTAYDALGRLHQVENPGGQIVTYAYSTNGQLSAVSDPLGILSEYEYDSLSGRLSAEENGEGERIEYGYNARGQVTNQFGSGTWPVQYAYNDFGKLSELKTWRDDSGAPDITTWQYDPVCGALTNKTDALERSVSWQIMPCGRITGRTWVRGVQTAYAYDALGSVTNITYSDGTPSVSLTYDRLGRVTGATDASGTVLNEYTLSGDLNKSSWQSGALAGTVLERGHDAFSRLSALTVNSNTVSQYQYDPLSRLSNVVFNTHSIRYGYDAGNPNRITQIQSGAAMFDSRLFDLRGRLTNLTVQVSGQTHFEHSRLYDNADRISRKSLEGEYWDYGYNPRGELTSAVRKTADGTPLPGQNLGYAFDDIGNRLSASRNGNASQYTNNALNQIDSRAVPNVLPVYGEAAEEATVTVNVQPTERLGTYFYCDATVTNENQAAWAEIYLCAVSNHYGPNDEDLVVETTGRLFAAASPEPFVYDEDGNLLQDGRWDYAWDAENRLAAIQTRTNLWTLCLPVKRLEFTYDYRGRRINKRVYTRESDLWSLTSDLRSVYDNWHLISEVRTQGTAVSTNSYCWGIDLSGSLYGAGGIGGLLAASLNGTKVFYTADGNGNVLGMIGVLTGTLLAEYEYTPFGKLYRIVEEQISANPFRFSTKYCDVETSFYNYGRRYYLPETGQWASRDPLGEQGGVNLYAFCRNNSVNYIDPLGLRDYSENETSTLIEEIGQQNFLQAIVNHSIAGTYDFKAKDKLDDGIEGNDTYTFNGVIMQSDQFGNFAAGYAGYEVGGLFGLEGVLWGGIAYDYFDSIRKEFSGSEFDWDKDSWPDIMAGAYYGRYGEMPPPVESENPCP